MGTGASLPGWLLPLVMAVANALMFRPALPDRKDLDLTLWSLRVSNSQLGPLKSWSTKDEQLGRAWTYMIANALELLNEIKWRDLRLSDIANPVICLSKEIFTCVDDRQDERIRSWSQVFPAKNCCWRDFLPSSSAEGSDLFRDDLEDTLRMWWGIRILALNSCCFLVLVLS